ncbi:MAG: ABC transporter substrate-binding protein [Anaeromyxobacteraceae bacterium]|nr:ABC transporter substrate-binding protein [Anaeromyxobacteraceae bacterium]
MAPAALLLAALVAAPAAAPPAKGGAPRPPADPVRHIRQAEARFREARAAGADAASLGDGVADYVDYEGLARRSLGTAWARQSAADRSALGGALRALLEATYLAGLRPGGEATLELREVGRTGRACVLQGTIAAGQRVVPVELRLERGAEGRPWRVFDATVGGLALLEGYQEQFQQLLALGGMKRLLAQLEQERQAALARLAAPPAAPAPAR